MAGLESYPYSTEIEDVYSIRNVPARRLPPRDLPLKPVKAFHSNVRDESNEEYKAAVRRYVEIAVSLATIITENLLSHPMVVLRRQCQVQQGSKRWHITPFTLAPVVMRLQQRQGIATLWKGLGSSLMIRGLVLAAEDSLSKFTPWPKEVNEITNVKSLGQHLLLKGVSLAIVTPFYSASLVETVQSDIASEKPGLMDVFREGLCRCVSVGSARGRMLPVWTLIFPTVAHGLLKYLISLAVRSAAAHMIHLQIRAEQVRRGALNKDIDSEENHQQVQVTASFIGMVVAEVVCYPLETILHRLHLQGTRTIVDQLDSGSSEAVVPILTAYSGVGDCYADAMAKEGFGGLYRGFGALIVQVAVHWAVIRLTRFLVCQATSLFRPASSSSGLHHPRKISEPPPPEDWPRALPQQPLLPYEQVAGEWRPPYTSTPTATPVTYQYPVPKRPDSR